MFALQDMMDLVSKLVQIEDMLVYLQTILGTARVDCLALNAVNPSGPATDFTLAVVEGLGITFV